MAINKDQRWRELNEKVEEYISNGAWYELGAHYYLMVEVLTGEGEDGGYLIELAHKAKLQAQNEIIHSYMESGVVSSAEILTNNGCCDSCQRLEARRYTISAAIELSPIPNSNCKNNISGCRCTYVPVV